MKRYLLSMAVVAALATPILADYLVIRINLGAEATEVASENQPPLGGGIMGGRGGQPGMGGGRGGLPGAGGGGAAAGGAMGLGGGGGRGGPPAFGGGGSDIGTGGGAAAGGAMGLGGGRGLPGAGGGGSDIGTGGGAAAGGAMGLGGGRGGLPGAGGGGSDIGTGGGAAAGGAMGLGGGGRGGPPAFGGGNLMGGGINPGNEGGGARPVGFVTNKGDLFIVATEVTVTKPRNSNNVMINHKWGQTVLNPDIVLPDRAAMQIIKVPGLEARFGNKRSEYIDSGSKQYMKFAEWMLENWNMPAEGKFSMQTKFEAYLNELNSLSANLSAGEKARLDALLKLRSEINKPVAEAKQEHELIKAVLTKFGKEMKPMQKGHFVIYHAPRDDKEAHAKLDKLESAYAGIMYWFALHGRPLPVPEKQMVGVLVEKMDSFAAVHKMFDDAPMYSDGFFSLMDNITIFAPSRVDPGYDKFFSMAKNAEATLKTYGLDNKKLFGDRIDRPIINQNSNDKQRVADVLTGQIFAIATNAAIDEGEASTATYEAFRQIAASTGYMPRTVMLPRWVRNGLGSFFATPKSSGDHNLPALWSGIGGEHWLHLPVFRKLAEARKSGETAEVTVDEKLPTRHKVKVGKLDVVAVVTDRVFEKADRASKNDQTFLMQKAEAESWALTYYLTKNRMNELKKFYDELTQMPRDLQLSAEVLEQAFGRSFDLLDAAGEKLDKNKVEKFESDWARYMNFANLTVDTSEKTR